MWVGQQGPVLTATSEMNRLLNIRKPFSKNYVNISDDVIEWSKNGRVPCIPVRARSTTLPVHTQNNTYNTYKNSSNWKEGMSTATHQKTQRIYTIYSLGHKIPSMISLKTALIHV
jgi:hypothetical protein